MLGYLAWEVVGLIAQTALEVKHQIDRLQPPAPPAPAPPTPAAAAAATGEKPHSDKSHSPSQPTPAPAAEVCDIFACSCHLFLNFFIYLYLSFFVFAFCRSLFFIVPHDLNTCVLISFFSSTYIEIGVNRKNQ